LIDDLLKTVDTLDDARGPGGIAAHALRALFGPVG